MKISEISEMPAAELLEHFPAVIMILDTENNILWANSRCREMAGFSEDEIEGRKCYSIWGLKGPCSDCPVLRAIKTGKTTRAELTPENRDCRPGTGHVWMSEGSPIHDESGKVIGAIQIARRINASRKEQDELARISRDWERTFASTNDAILVLDRNHRIIRSNRTAELLFGLEAGEMAGRYCWEIVHGTDEPVLGCPRIEAMRSLGRETMQLRLGEKWYEVAADPVLDSTGEYDGCIHTLKDVTERKIADEELRASENFQRSILRAAPVGIGVVVDRVFRQVNERFCDMLGYTREELAGENARMIYPTDSDYEYVGVEKYGQIKREGTGTVETRFRRRDGEVIDVLLSSSPLDSSDLSKGVTFTALDITEMKRAGREIEKSRQDAERYLNIAAEIIISLDREGRIVLLNDSGHRVLGYEPPDLLGEDWFERCLPERNRDEVGDIFRKIIAGETTGLNLVEGKVVTRDGKEKTILWHNSLLRNESGEVTGILSSGEDITKRKEAEVALIDSEKRYRSLFETLVQGVVYQNARGEITSANPAAERILGLTVDQINGRTSSDPEWKAVNESGEELPGDQHPSMIVLRTGEPVLDFTMGVFNPRRNSYVWIIVNSVPQFREGEKKPFQVYSTFLDITARRKVENKLRESEKRLRYTLAATTDGIWYWNFETGKLTFSPRYYQMLGYETGEFEASYESWKKLIHPDDLAGALDRAESWLKNREGPYENQFRLRRRDGSYIYVLSHGEVVKRDSRGGAVLMVGNHMDISEKVRWEQSLIETRDFYENIIEGVQDGIWVTDRDDEILFCNRRMEDIAGISKDLICGKNIFTDFSEETSGEVREYYLEAKKKQKPVWYEVKVETPAGRDSWQNGWLIPILEGSDFLGMICTVRDVTELKKDDRHLRFLAHTINQITDVVTVTDLEGRITYVNDACSKMLGRSREELVGLSVEEYGGTDDEIGKQREIIEMTTKNGYWRGEVVNISSGGNRSILDSRTHLIRDSSGEPIAMIGIATDITARVRGEEVREELRERLAQSQKMESVGRLAGGVAHDYNNMLSVILGYTEMALGRISSEEALHSDLTEIHRAASRSRDITAKLLAFARKQTIEPEVLDLNENISGILNMLRSLIGEDMELVWQPENDIDPIRMDPSQVDQIITNLCINARDAADGTGRITIQTRNAELDESYCGARTGVQPGKYVMLSVSDDGRGMKRDELENIFEPFFTTKDESRGTGLGLATVYGIIKQNNGSIDVSSKPGEGSTFRLYMPSYRGNFSEKEEEGEKGVPRSRGEAVLLVEDEEAIMNLGTRMLKKLGYRVFTAQFPGEALELADELSDHIDLIVTDVIMPEMNGSDLADRLKVFFPDARVLFMSGYTSDVIEHRGILDEGVNFIQKPFSLKELAGKVRKALDGR
ncbi:MAG: PAS domain S-box protein [Candidatus Latescibacteria bacterium]|nr:PAS domain S-box protein [bacterium]MBD3424435.1 PAS domain S-box protein [Candidatus Latescibacterota bacterium]